MTRARIGALACLALALLWAAPAQATTYYVSNGTNGAVGDDARSCATAATITTPKLTIAAGIACASASDTVYIRGGTYTGGANVIDAQRFTVNSGTSYANAPVISGYTGETVIIQPPTGLSAIKISDSGPSAAAHYIIIQDLRIENVNNIFNGQDSAEAVFFYTAHHIRMQRLDISGGYGFGIHLGHSTPFIELLHSRVHDIGQPGGTLTAGHALYWSGSDAIIQYNQIDHNQGWGIHLYCNVLCPGHADPSRANIQFNDIHHNGQNGTGFGVVVSYGSDNLVQNNQIHHNPGGVQVYTDSSNTMAYNNSIVDNSPYDGVWMQYYGSAPVIKQNIVYNPAGGSGGGITDYAGGTGSPVLANNVTTNPGFTDYLHNIYTITTSSAAYNIAACLSGVSLDYAGNTRGGSNCEAGAYEVVTGGGVSPIIDTLTLPNTQVGAVYSQMICASSGTPAYTHSKSSGTYPNGLALSSTTIPCAILSGTLTTQGTFTFTQLVTDSNGLTGSRSFTITVDPASMTCSGGTAPWFLITGSCVGAGSSNGTANATTASVTNTGGDITFCTIASDKNQTYPTLSDSLGNSYSLVGSANIGEYGVSRLFASRLTVFGSVTYTANTGSVQSFPAIYCFTMSGSRSTPLDYAIDGGGALSSQSKSAGLVATNQTLQLTVAALSAEDANTVSLPGFTVYQLAYSLSKYFGVAIGWKVHVVRASEIPVWTWASPMSVSTVAGVWFNIDSYVPRLRVRVR